MSDQARRRKLRAPREDGGVLIDPPCAALPQAVAANVADRATWSFDLAGETVSCFTAAARAEFIAEALRYSREYRDIDRVRSKGTGPDENDAPKRIRSPLAAHHAPLLLAGHQPELFHAGVWAKNFALSGLAAAVGGTAVNLVIDGDTLKTASLRVPSGTPREPLVESVPFDTACGEIPFEERRVLDEELFASFGRRATETLRLLLSGPLLETFWPEVVRQAAACDRLGLAVARARHKLEGFWGLQTLELPQSRVCDSHHFRRFAGHLLSDLPRFVEAHNAELRTFKARENIRSANHPVPALERDGDRFEAPLWLWTVDEPRRRHVFARRRGDEIELTDRGAITLKLPLTDPRHDDFAAALGEAARRGIRLRSRALLTTMYARLVLGDLFLHGIGGGKYDELTDAIIVRFLAVRPPEFAIVTATRKLPLSTTASGASADKFSTAVDEPTAKHHLWELRHHPERFVDPAVLSTSDERATVAAAVAEKFRWSAVVPTRETAQIRCQAIRAANEAMQPFLDGERQKWLKIQAEARSSARVSELLGSREYSAFLFPEKDLRDFLLAISACPR